ncbi:MAG: hypothetical protein KF819_16845 [Labilithrix sp.]|nr:hypothetical protein [Labilithrix sp.]
MAERSFRARAPRIAITVAAAAFAVGAAVVAAAQRSPGGASGRCAVTTWEPLRAAPWLAVGLLAMIAYAVVMGIARRRREAPISLGEGPYRVAVVDASTALARPRWHFFALGVLLGVACAAGSVASRTTICPYAVPASCKRVGGSIVFVPVGKVDRRVVAELADHFRECYRLPVVVGPPVEPPASAWNPEREQWIGESVLAAIPSCYDGDPLCDPEMIVGVTADDIYTTAETWRYAYALRDTRRPTVIVSTARMGTLTGLTSTSYERARKMIAKQIALSYCGLSATLDSKSVRYGRIMGPDELDAIDEWRW